MVSYLGVITDGGDKKMKRIKTITTRDMAESRITGGCGECQTSCQSASKTSCSVANQHCEQRKEK